MYLTSFVTVAPFFRMEDPRVTSRTNKFFAKALDTLADVLVDDKTLSAYLHHKATAWYRMYPPVHNPDRMDDTLKVLVKNHEGPKESDAGNVATLSDISDIMELSSHMFWRTGPLVQSIILRVPFGIWQRKRIHVETVAKV